MAATEVRQRVRVLALKVEIDWRREESRTLFRRLRDLGWQAAHYRNSMIRSRWAEAMGWRVDPAEADKHDITKQARQRDKGELSGDAYSCCEQEVQGAWTRDCKKILAGQPLPEFKPSSALSVSGKQKKVDSGIKLEIEGGQYVLYLRAQSKNSPDGSWLRLPIAKNSRRDDFQSPILNAMVAWSIPIKKATVHVGERSVTARLTYRDEVRLAPMGQRVAALGPIDRDGRLILRTETQQRDYTSRLTNVINRKDSWDLIRRRALCQLGWRKGHARAKRAVLARKTWADWLRSYLHEWSRDLVEWCRTQGIGMINIRAIGTGDWPADLLIQKIRYKAEDYGIAVNTDAGVNDSASERAYLAVVRKGQKEATRRARAVRELTDQLGN